MESIVCNSDSCEGVKYYVFYVLCVFNVEVWVCENILTRWNNELHDLNCDVTTLVGHVGQVGQEVIALSEHMGGRQLNGDVIFKRQMIIQTRENIWLTDNNEPGCWTVRKCGHCGLWQWE